eukprot:6176054-Alexandrium_andersonii.AAC.1
MALRQPAMRSRRARGILASAPLRPPVSRRGATTTSCAKQTSAIAAPRSRPTGSFWIKPPF